MNMTQDPGPGHRRRAAVEHRPALAAAAPL